MPNDRLLKKLLFGQVKGCCPPGGLLQAVLGLISMILQCMVVLHQYTSKNAENRLLWRDKTCLART